MSFIEDASKALLMFLVLYTVVTISFAILRHLGINIEEDEKATG